MVSFQPFIQFNHAIGGIVPPENEADYQHLVGLMQNLTDQYQPDDPRVVALFDVLVNYISQWEAQDESIFPQGTALDVLRHLMEQHQVSQSDLEAAGVASQGQISNVLAGRREISKHLAQKLAEYFKVSVQNFL